MRRAGCVLAFLTGAAAGCSADAADPSIVIAGLVTSADAPAPAGAIRLAVVWDTGTWFQEVTVDDDGMAVVRFPRHFFAFDQGYQGEFPMAYEIEISSPPPEGAMVDTGRVGEGTGRAAWGQLVAYADDNGNAELDPCTDAVASCPDRVLATSNPRRPVERQIWLEYLEDLAPEGHTLRGYPYVALPADTSVDLELSDDPWVAALACDELVLVSDPAERAACDGDGPPAACSTRPPAGAELECHPGGRGYEWWHVVWQPCRRTTVTGGFQLSPGQPPPADWPCGGR